MLRRTSHLMHSLVAPLVLVSVACCQLLLAHAHGLSAWKGGGFGMFSTVDSVSARYVRIYLQHRGGTTPVEAPRTQAMKRLLERLRALPSQTQLDALGSLLVRQTWLPAGYDPFTAQRSAARRDAGPTRIRAKLAHEPEPPVSDTIQPDSVRVELWRYRFDAERRQVHAYLALVSTQSKRGSHERR